MTTDKTIPLTGITKKRLISMKIHPRETFDDILNRLMNEYKKHQKESQQKLDR